MVQSKEYTTREICEILTRKALADVDRESLPDACNVTVVFRHLHGEVVGAQVTFAPRIKVPVNGYMS